MSEIETVYKALRLLPEFDGNPNVLTRFIKLCDQLVNEFVRNEAGCELRNLALLNGILNKVTGPAARLINSNGIPDSWQGIRSALINSFADQRDETSLYNDLALLTQGSSSPQEFYESCQSLFSTIMTYISLHETVGSTIESKRTLYKKLTLQAFLRGLRDPLGSRIRCMRPETIEKALEFVHEEVNTLYLQRRNDNFSEKKNIPPHGQIGQPFKFPNTQVSSSPRPPTFNTPGPSRQLPQRVPIWRPPQNLQYRGPSRTQQVFGAQLPNYRPSTNVFKLAPRNSVPDAINTVKPMSGVSHYVSKPMPVRGHDWSKFGNPPPTNYFRSREANFNYFYNEPTCDSPDYYYEAPGSDYIAYNEEYYNCEPQPYYYEPNYSDVVVEECPEENSPLSCEKSSQDFPTDPNLEKSK